MRDGLIEERDLLDAREALGDAVHRTPLVASRTLSDLSGAQVLLKAELFQKTGSFKTRGILYRLLRSTAEERARGFVSISAGNAAAALAWAAARVGSRAAIVMPRTASRSKIEATEAYGGEVVPTDGDYMGTMDAVRAERGSIFVHPFDDPDVLAGHGVAGLEILEEASDLDAVIVPVGGGGLIGGVASAIKLLRPEVEVVGVEPTGADVMSRSLAAGHVETLVPETVADGLAAPFAGVHTLRHAQARVDRIVRVEDREILRAMNLLWTRCKLAAEPSAAAPIAALLAAGGGRFRGKTVACVISGGNVDPSVVTHCLIP